MKPAAPKLPRVLDEAVDWQACQRDGRVRGAYLKSLDLSDADLEEMTFDRCVLEQCCLTGANLERCSFTDVKLIGWRTFTAQAYMMYVLGTAAWRTATFAPRGGKRPVCKAAA